MADDSVEDGYDLVVIGAGQGGIPLATTLVTQHGWRVAMVERKELGGSCVNFGCTPTKAVIASARVAQLARRGAEFGVHIPTVQIDFPAVMNGARAITKESRDGLEEEFGGEGQPALLRGHARLAGRAGNRYRIHIAGATGERTITAQHVVLDTGTRAAVPKIEGLVGIPYLSADNWLHSDVLPAQLVILGGGYIGLEMSQFYARMGSKVTVIDRSPHLVEREEPEVATTLQPLLEAEGIVFHGNATVTKTTAENGGVTVTFTDGSGHTQTVRGSHLFLATGRTPNTADLGLDTVGITPGPTGFIPVDERLATTAEGVWVIGDIRGGPMFTHTSWDDFRILLSQLTGDRKRTTDRLVPYAIFTDPAVGRVGMTESEAREAGKSVRIGHFEMLHNGHAREYREKNGFIKVIVDSETDRLLGATVVGEQGAELVQFYATLMNADAPYTVIRDAVVIHPTLCEAVQSATESVQ